MYDTLERLLNIKYKQSLNIFRHALKKLLKRFFYNKGFIFPHCARYEGIFKNCLPCGLINLEDVVVRRRRKIIVKKFIKKLLDKYVKAYKK